MTLINFFFERFKLASLFFFLILWANNVYSQRPKVWLDADTGNETDDVYAIVKLLTDTTVDLVGLSSAHFNNADLVSFTKWNQYKTKGITTVKISQQLNEEILKLNNKSNINHPLGADRQMGRAWGGFEPRSSPAALQIIATVKQLAPHQKLIVLNLGALTNLASAIALDTSIASHINCYLLGASYNAEKQYWNKSEFNIRNDLNAFDYLLNNPMLNITIMPVSTAEPFRFERDFLYSIFDTKNPVLKYLKQRWEDTNPQDEVRTLWDVALIEAYLDPSMATVQSVVTPPENTQRQITVYTKIDETKMKESFIKTIKSIQ